MTEDAGHHGLDDDHHHHDGEPDSDVMWWQDNVILHSVGVDIGSATTQIAFSRLHLKRHAAGLTSRYVVVARELVYDSGVLLTPYADGNQIDAVALGVLLDRAYAGSGWSPDDVDTGAVILTGEALRRVNAERIGRLVSERAGKLVCATAGHHMEALLAAYGSGAVRRSHDEKSVLLNVDVGGGTTKVALVRDGQILGTAAFLVGGRLAAVDKEGRLIRLEPGGIRHAAATGITWRLGDIVEPSELEAVGDEMAEAVVDAINGKPDLYLTDLLPGLGRVDGVVVSGGVSAFLHEDEPATFGDLGPALADGLRRRFDDGQMPGPLLAGSEAIRATVVGASEHTVQLSGLTGHITDSADSLPRRDLPVAHLNFDLAADEVDPDALADAVRTAFEVRDLGSADQEAVLAINWLGEPRYQRLAALAAGLKAGLAARTAQLLPVYLMIDGDVAMTLGRLLVEEFGFAVPLVVLDGVHLRAFDHVDIGRVRPVSGNVPITIKSLAFTHGGD